MEADDRQVTIVSSFPSCRNTLRAVGMLSKLFFSSTFPATSLGFTILGESFTYAAVVVVVVVVVIVFNPTKEVVPFHLRGLCMLGAFFLPTFTHLGHECQDLLSPCDGIMCAQIRPRFILSSERVMGNEVGTNVNSKGKIPSTGGSEEGRTRDAASRRAASPTHYRLSYFGPKLRKQDTTTTTTPSVRSSSEDEVSMRFLQS